MMAAPKVKVAVIGAGLAGLAAARCFAEFPNKLDVVVFEKNQSVGGVWIYDSSETTEHWFYGAGKHIERQNGYSRQHEDGFTSCLYKNLRTNVPKEIMALPGFPFPPHLDSFVTHTDVLQYMDDFTNHFKLHPYIRLDHTVVNVGRIMISDKDMWKVTYLDASHESKTDIFDAVVVCNGHFTTPLYPKITGLSHFTGKLLHSRFYRDPEPFREEVIVVMGAGASGLDISVDLSPFAKDIYLSHGSKRIQSRLPSNVHDSPLVDCVNDAGRIIFQDGSSCDADVILCCTGYQMTFPFLDDSCDVAVEDNTLTSIYKHMFHCQHPSLSFVSLNYQIIPSWHFPLQAECIRSVLLGDVVLPSATEMLQDTQNELEEMGNLGVPKHHFHHLGQKQWSYLNDMSSEFSCTQAPAAISDLATLVEQDRGRNLLTYRSHNYVIVDDNTFKFSDKHNVSV